jgi:hypothetical protein
VAKADDKPKQEGDCFGNQPLRESEVGLHDNQFSGFTIGSPFGEANASPYVQVKLSPRVVFQ